MFTYASRLLRYFLNLFGMADNPINADGRHVTILGAEFAVQPSEAF
jgi:hypothetical protein